MPAKWKALLHLYGLLQAELHWPGHPTFQLTALQHIWNQELRDGFGRWCSQHCSVYLLKRSFFRVHMSCLGTSLQMAAAIIPTGIATSRNVVWILGASLGSLRPVFGPMTLARADVLVLVVAIVMRWLWWHVSVTPHAERDLESQFTHVNISAAFGQLCAVFNILKEETWPQCGEQQSLCGADILQDPPRNTACQIYGAASSFPLVKSCSFFHEKLPFSCAHLLSTPNLGIYVSYYWQPSCSGWKPKYFCAKWH